MKIVIVIEGKTEKAFLQSLRKFLQSHLAGKMPRIESVPYDGRIPKADKLKNLVIRLLSGSNAADHVIAITDVYTGTNPPDFIDADDAKKKMRIWVGEEKRFHPHAAQYEFEAWLLPYWSSIQKLAKHNKAAPPGNPESVNHTNPPSKRIEEIFRIGKCRDSYIKTRDAGRILMCNDLSIAISASTELKSLISTIITISAGTKMV